MDKKLKNIVIDARAKVMWGESRSDIQTWLYSQGLTEQQVRAVLRATIKERGREVRKIGIRDIAIGIVAGLGSVLIFVSEHRNPLSDNRGAWVLGILLGGISIWILIRGFDRLIGGSKHRGSITDM